MVAKLVVLHINHQPTDLPHCSDAIMSAMASQITGDSIVHSTVCSGADQRKRVIGLCDGNSPMTGEFPAQWVSNAENVSIWWRHHEIQWPNFWQWQCSMNVHLMVSWAWNHDDVIKWKHFPRNWPFVRGIHRSPVNSPHKGQWRGALMFSLICAWTNCWANNGDARDLGRYRSHCDVRVMTLSTL